MNIFSTSSRATYGHSGAVLANSSVQNHIEVVVAGVQGATDDAHDGEGVQLKSKYGQLRKHRRLKVKQET